MELPHPCALWISLLFLYISNAITIYYSGCMTNYEVTTSFKNSGLCRHTTIPCQRPGMTTGAEAGALAQRAALKQRVAPVHNLDLAV